MSIQGLPYLHAIHFCNVLERPLTQLNSSALWGKARDSFITKVGRRATSIEIIPLTILAMEGVGEGKLGMMTAFHRTYQTKVETLDAPLTIVQWDSPEPGVVVVKVFTNSPHLPWGSFKSPYLDMTTLSGGALTTQFPTCPAAFPQVVPLFSLSVFPSMKRKREIG